MGMEMQMAQKEDEREEAGEGMEVADEGQGSSRRQKHLRTDAAVDQSALRALPGILLVGPPAVGKRALLERLTARGRRTAPAASDSGAISRRWTIDTKYYTAKVGLWTARLENPALEDGDSIKSEFGQCEALVMVFDLSSANSFEQLQDWVRGVDLNNFEILLCIGNKADRIPEHFAHAEYRRKLQKSGESSFDPHPEFYDFGIDRAEGSGLLEEGETVSHEEKRRSCVEWCVDLGIEYIEACGINEAFDECLSIDGDLQGVARMHGALTAHMWPGFVMKDKDESKSTASQNEEQEMTSDDDSDYYVEYELLSNGSAEPWEASGWEDQWSFSSQVEEPAIQSTDAAMSAPASVDAVSSVSGSEREDSSASSSVPSSTGTPAARQQELETQSSGAQSSVSGHREFAIMSESNGKSEAASTTAGDQPRRKKQEMDQMEQLMREMSNMRSNAQSMTDEQRREMAAGLAMRMASLFSDDEDGASDIE